MIGRVIYTISQLFIAYIFLSLLTGTNDTESKGNKKAAHYAYLTGCYDSALNNCFVHIKDEIDRSKCYDESMIFCDSGVDVFISWIYKSRFIEN